MDVSGSASPTTVPSAGAMPQPAPSRLIAHPDRGLILAEVHARPFAPMATPSRVLHFAFLTDAEQAAADRAALARFCAERGVAGPSEDAKHHRVRLNDTGLRWEQHSEFTTYSWELQANGSQPFEPPPTMLPQPMLELPQPGPHLVSVDLHLVVERPTEAFDRLFDASSLAVVSVDGGAAMAATDFRACADGFVRVLVRDRSLTPAQTGALAQRLHERLAPLADHTHVAEVRQTGMIAAVELVRDKATREPFPAAERRGLRVYRHGLERGAVLRPLGNVVYFMPPFCITPDEIDFMVEVAVEGIERAID